MTDNNSYINHSAEISQHIIRGDKFYPNNNEIPVLVYKAVLDLPETDQSRVIEKTFNDNGWKNSWVDGIFNYHHYHSITHEVIGVSKGNCMLLLGGDDGEIKTINKGDVVLIPAGVAHKNVGSSDDFECVGAYPGGLDFDIKLGKPETERPEADNNIKNVPVPERDPVFGLKGPVVDFWKKGKLESVEGLTVAQF